MKSEPDNAGMSHSRLFLRLYAEIETIYQARSLAQKLIIELKTCSPVVLHRFFKYWKIPTYYGFEFDFYPDASYEEAFDCIIALSPDDWSLTASMTERSSAWTLKRGGIFLADQVRWANLELFYDRNPES